MVKLNDMILSPGMGEDKTPTQPTVVDKQPHYGHYQIQSREEIEEGMLLYKHHTKEGEHHTNFLRVLKEPFQNEEGKWKIEVIHARGSVEGYKTEMFLSDVAVVSYSNGKWNNHNWLERVE